MTIFLVKCWVEFLPQWWWNVHRFSHSAHINRHIRSLTFTLSHIANICLPGFIFFHSTYYHPTCYIFCLFMYYCPSIPRRQQAPCRWWFLSLCLVLASIIMSRTWSDIQEIFIERKNKLPQEFCPCWPLSGSFSSDFHTPGSAHVSSSITSQRCFSYLIYIMSVHLCLSGPLFCFPHKSYNWK